jgi:hypothetical protein
LNSSEIVTSLNFLKATSIDVPFYSQRVNWNGEDSGFPNQRSIDEWQQNCCGIACARMIIDCFTGQKPTYWDLLQLGLKMKAYIEAGWIHKGLVDLIGTFGVIGQTHRNKNVGHLAETIKKGSICIASVTVLFLGGRINKATGIEFRKGGHLVVAHSVSNEGIVCHHPSSRETGNYENWVVPFSDWESSFSGNYMEFNGLRKRPNN